MPPHGAPAEGYPGGRPTKKKKKKMTMTTGHALTTKQKRLTLKKLRAYKSGNAASGSHGPRGQGTKTPSFDARTIGHSKRHKQPR